MGFIKCATYTIVWRTPVFLSPPIQLTNLPNIYTWIAQLLLLVIHDLINLLDYLVLTPIILTLMDTDFILCHECGYINHLSDGLLNVLFLGRDRGVCTKSRRALTLDTPRSPPLAVW